MRNKFVCHPWAILHGAPRQVDLGQQARRGDIEKSDGVDREAGANARAQQLNEVLSEFMGQSANATAEALNDRGLPTARGGK